MQSVFYETGHGIGINLFKLEQGVDFSFPYHLHRCYEIVYMFEGEMDITIEGEVFKVCRDEMILIKPHMIHGMETKGHSKHKLCIFSPELIGGVGENLQKRTLSTPIVKTDGKEYRNMFIGIDEADSVCRIKGFLYYICDAFLRNLTPADGDEHNPGYNKLLHDILAFIEFNYTSSCSLYEVSKKLNYSYTYISKIFNETVGIPYNVYVTQLRISKACSLLQNSDLSMIETAHLCGFPSVRSFNRNFIKCTGKTPSEYKNKI